MTTAKPGLASRFRVGSFIHGEPVRRGVADGGAAPKHDRERESAADADPIHHPAREQQTDRIGELES